jgi:hypothetical protein
MTRVVTHLRRNVVAYIALFVALGGTSYAAVSVASHSLLPKNFNPKYIGGYVRAWASVGANGRILASGGGVRAGSDPIIAGHYVITWRPLPATKCTTIGSVAIGQSLTPGYLISQAYRTPSRGLQAIVQTYDSLGQPAALPFSVALVCATPRS